MSPRVVRAAVLAICAVGIAGMVAGSIGDDNAVALTFGLITASAVACLIVATAVAAGTSPGTSHADEARGARIEELVGTIVAAGADEATVRELVGEAVRLGRGLPASGAGAEETAGRDEKDEKGARTGGKAGAGVHGGRTPRPDSRTFT